MNELPHGVHPLQPVCDSGEHSHAAAGRRTMTLFTYFWKLGRSVFAFEMPAAARVRAVAIPVVMIVVGFVVTAALRTPAEAFGVLNHAPKSKFDLLLERSR